MTELVWGFEAFELHFLCTSIEGKPSVTTACTHCVADVTHCACNNWHFCGTAKVPMMTASTAKADDEGLTSQKGHVHTAAMGTQANNCTTTVGKQDVFTGQAPSVVCFPLGQIAKL